MVLYSRPRSRGDETMQRPLKRKPPSSEALPLGETLMSPEELRRILMRLEKVAREFSARERIPELLRIVVARAEFRNDLIGVV